MLLNNPHGRGEAVGHSCHPLSWGLSRKDSTINLGPALEQTWARGRDSYYLCNALATLDRTELLATVFLLTLMNTHSTGLQQTRAPAGSGGRSVVWGDSEAQGLGLAPVLPWALAHQQSELCRGGRQATWPQEDGPRDINGQVRSQAECGSCLKGDVWRSGAVNKRPV